MLKLKGLTLLEVVTALAITAILLPVMGMVFYNMLTTPPEQTARLTLNDEVALLATWLYNDTHRADTFTVGNGSPYYGNFTWTDYSQLNPLGGYNEYLISYYSSCPPGSDPDCINSVVRQVFLTNGSTVWPTATPTSTATATPTPTSTEIPAEQTYTYCSGGGTNKWAWARAWNNTEWFTQGHPTDPDDFFEDYYDREIVTASAADYSLICTINNESWSEPDTDSPIDYGVSSQLYVIDVAQDRDEVSDLGVTWRGYGGVATQNVKLEIWNYTTSAWTSIIDEGDPDSRNNDTYTWDTSSSPENYIEASTGYVTMLASADADETIPGEFDFGTALYFNGSASNTVTTNSTVPTNTFTFEAWVKCTEEHEIDAESTSSTTGVNNQHYVFWPSQRGTNGGAGLSVGTNGISVYEHGDSYMPPLAVYEGSLGTAWNHIAVVYDSKQPKIYLNGNLVETGSTSPKTTVYAPYIIGGDTYGYFTGWIDEVRIWNIALNQSQIQDNMYTENPTAAGTATITEVYTSDDSFTPPAGVTSVEVLVVGGGGGGGGAYEGANYFHGGGGGAGGVVYDDDFSVTPGVPITVTVGAGGTGGMGYSSGTTYPGDDGEDSVFSTITAYGGGGGGGGNPDSGIAFGRDGGSGGGSGTYCTGLCWTDHGSIGDGGSGTAGQGNDGGMAYYECCWAVICTCPARSASGGGGGAGAVGAAAVIYTSGNGGNGLDYSSYFGAVGGAGGWFGGGGGGGEIATRTPGTGGQGGGGDGGLGLDGEDATANTGGGGGGAGSSGSSTRQGGDGGSGIVIVQYDVPGSNLVGLWHFNDCYVDILDGVMEDSSTYDNDGTLSSPGPECSMGVSSDLTVYTDYIALTVTTPGEPVPTPEPRPTDTYPTSTYTPQVAASTGCLAGDAEITSPTDTCTACGGYGGGWTAASSGDLTNINSDNNVRWVTEHCPASGETNYQRYYVTIGSSIDIANISQIDVRVQGYGDNEPAIPRAITAKIWKYTGSTWETIDTRNNQASDYNFDISITSGISNYFSGKTLAILFRAVDDTAVPCPRMYAWDGGTYQFIDSALSGRLLKRLGGTNYPTADVLTPRDGYYDLIIREPSYETSYLDRLELWAVDHPEGTEIVAEADGTIHTVSDPKTVSAVDSYGDDVTSLLADRDGINWNPDNAAITAKDFTNESQMQDWIELTLPDIPQTTYYDTSVNSGTAKLIVTAHYNPLSLLQIWSYYVYILGSPNHDALVERLETDYEFAPYFDYGLWGCIAFQVEIWNGSEWTYYTDIKITDGPSHIALLDLSQIQGDKIRLRVPAGAFDIDYVAVDYSSDKPVTVTELQPAEAYRLSHSPSGSLTTADVLQNISAEDGSYATLHLDDWLNYKFEALDYAPADGMTRSFVIPCTGYYIPEGPEVTEDKSYNWPLLEQISYEPLAFQKWVYPIYVDWLNNGGVYDCNDYEWAYCSPAPFHVREGLPWDKRSVNTDLVQVTITEYIAYRTLTISAGTGGNVSPAAPGDYYFINTEVPITATATEECYEFDAWTGDTDTIADVNDPTTTIVMDDDYSITATFKETTDTYSLSLASDPEGAGYPYFAGASPFECGTDVTISASPNPGYTFLGWTPTDGVANASLEDTTVHMTQARTLTAHFNGSGSLPTATPTPELVQESALYLTQHVQVDKFRLIPASDDLIIAEIESGMNSSMGDYLTKTLTLYLRMRPSYQLPEVSIWGEDSVSILGGILFSGDYNSISGNVKVNGTVTVGAAAEYNDIDGTLTCPEIVWEGGSEDEDQLSYTQLITQQADNAEEMQEILDRLGDPQLLFKANLSVGTTDWDEADDIHQYAFTGDVDFTDVGSDAYNHCWADLDTHELKPGLYYSPGTIELTTTWDGPTSGTVTFIAGEQIIISNGQNWGWITDPTIRLTAYDNELLFWANGSTADPETEDGVILITGNSDWHACASLEGVMFAPNGEIELSGGGAEGWFGYIMPAELYEGALIGQYLTLSGSHWNFYRW